MSSGSLVDEVMSLSSFSESSDWDTLSDLAITPTHSDTASLASDFELPNGVMTAFMEIASDNDVDDGNALHKFNSGTASCREVTNEANETEKLKEGIEIEKSDCEDALAEASFTVHEQVVSSPTASADSVRNMAIRVKYAGADKNTQLAHDDQSANIESDKETRLDLSTLTHDNIIATLSEKTGCRGPLSLREISELIRAGDIAQIVDSFWGAIGLERNEFTPVWVSEQREMNGVEAQIQAARVKAKATLDAAFREESENLEIFCHRFDESTDSAIIIAEWALHQNHYYGALNLENGIKHLLQYDSGSGN